MEEKTVEKNLESEEVSLKGIFLKIVELYRYLLSKAIIILVFIVIGSGLGYFYAYNKKMIYTATTTFVLEDSEKGGGLGQYSGLASMVGVDLGGSGGGIFQGDNIMELYKSRAMIEKTLLTEVEIDNKKQLLINRYIDFNKLRLQWAERPELKAISFKKNDSIEVHGTSDSRRLQDSILGTIVADIGKNYLFVTKPDKKLSIIKTDVIAGDEFFAKSFDEQIVKNVNDFYIQTKTRKTVSSIAILQHKTDSVRSVMNGAIYAAAVVTDATPNLNVTRQVQRTAPVQRSQFNAEMNKIVLSELMKNLEISKMGLLKETPLIQVIDGPVLPLEKKKFGKLKGIVLGGMLFGFLSVCFFILKKLIANILA